MTNNKDNKKAKKMENNNGIKVIVLGIILAMLIPCFTVGSGLIEVGKNQGIQKTKIEQMEKKQETFVSKEVFYLTVGNINKNLEKIANKE